MGSSQRRYLSAERVWKMHSEGNGRNLDSYQLKKIKDELPLQGV